MVGGVSRRLATLLAWPAIEYEALVRVAKGDSARVWAYNCEAREEDQGHADHVDANVDLVVVVCTILPIAEEVSKVSITYARGRTRPVCSLVVRSKKWVS